MEFLSIKVQNLISKRQLVIQMLSIIVGGVIGLLFLPVTFKTIALVVAGIYYIFVLLLNYVKLDATIDKLLKTAEGNK